MMSASIIQVLIITIILHLNNNYLSMLALIILHTTKSALIEKLAHELQESVLQSYWLIL